MDRPDPATLIKNVVTEASEEEHIGILVLCLNKHTDMLALLSMNISSELATNMLDVSLKMLRAEDKPPKGAH